MSAKIKKIQFICLGHCPTKIKRNISPFGYRCREYVYESKIKKPGRSKHKNYTSIEEDMSLETPPKRRGVFAIPHIRLKRNLFSKENVYKFLPPGSYGNKGSEKYKFPSTEYVFEFGTAKMDKKHLLAGGKVFDKCRRIWHHLSEYASENEYIQVKGTWVLSEYEDYINILNRYCIEYIRTLYALNSVMQAMYARRIEIDMSDKNIEVFI